MFLWFPKRRRLGGSDAAVRRALLKPTVRILCGVIYTALSLDCISIPLPSGFDALELTKLTLVGSAEAAVPKKTKQRKVVLRQPRIGTRKGKPYTVAKTEKPVRSARVRRTAAPKSSEQASTRAEETAPVATASAKRSGDEASSAASTAVAASIAAPLGAGPVEFPILDTTRLRADELGSAPVGKAALSDTPPKPSELSYHPAGYPILDNLDALRAIDETRSFAVDGEGNKIFFTLNPDLQLKARSLLQRYSVPWGSIVALEPRSGRVLAMASYSTKEPAGGDLSTRATFPAASLFKLITAAAAIERAGLSGDDVISFRGGNYTLERFNYLPDARRDRRKISFADALGKSVNPAFARVGLNHLNIATLERYATNFGFNNRLPFDGPVDVSSFQRPADDYETARTAAGFGEVHISPLHAAVMTATIANRGLMMRPYLVDEIVAPSGQLKYRAHNTPVRTSIMSSTSRELLSMMQATVENGTARRQFVKVKSQYLRSTSIAAKTGTLSGDNPKGVYHWFVAAVPAENPEIAVCTLIIDPGNARVKSSALAREILEHYFRNRTGGIETRNERKEETRS